MIFTLVVNEKYIVILMYFRTVMYAMYPFLTIRYWIWNVMDIHKVKDVIAKETNKGAMMKTFKQAVFYHFDKIRTSFNLCLVRMKLE
jgi:hypothetical protein